MKESSKRPGRALAAALAVVFAAGVTPAFAQESPVQFNIGIGPVFPNGEVADRFDTGFSVPVGLTFNINEHFGIGVEYAGGWMKGPSRLLPDPRGGLDVIQIESNHTFHSGTFNLVYRFPSSGRVGGYVLGGPGVYRRQVELTTPTEGFEEVVICDPYWFVCGPGLAPVPVDEVLGSRSTTDVGFNVGGGMTFGYFYVEVRYHYTRGPVFNVPNQPSSPGAGPTRADGHYVPINFGFRW